MRRNHPRVVMGPITTIWGERAAMGWGNVELSSGSWGFQMMLPRSAPEDGRPLCHAVTHKRESVWQFEEDHKQFQGLRQKQRVHLYQLNSGQATQFALVEVLEGDPDFITRIYRIDGDEFSLEVETLMKIHVGKLWGMKVRQRAEERRVLNRLMQPRNKSR